MAPKVWFIAGAGRWKLWIVWRWKLIAGCRWRWKLWFTCLKLKFGLTITRQERPYISLMGYSAGGSCKICVWSWSITCDLGVGSGFVAGLVPGLKLEFYYVYMQLQRILRTRVFFSSLWACWIVKLWVSEVKVDNGGLERPLTGSWHCSLAGKNCRKCMKKPV